MCYVIIELSFRVLKFQLLDTRNLKIHSVHVNSEPVKWHLKPITVQAFGSCLEIIPNTASNR